MRKQRVLMSGRVISSKIRLRVLVVCLEGGVTVSSRMGQTSYVAVAGYTNEDGSMIMDQNMVSTYRKLPCPEEEYFNDLSLYLVPVRLVGQWGCKQLT